VWGCYTYNRHVKVKRTYQLSREIVQAVRDLVQRRHLAPSQDALVETALREFVRRQRDAEEAEIWAAAASDPELAGEASRFEQEFGASDRQTWPA
jgi:hypothetical protein